MAATIAKAIGYDKNRRKECHRLGSREAVAQANTFKTFSTVGIQADGSGFCRVSRLNELGESIEIHFHTWGPE